LPRNKHPEETARKILDASLKLFLEKGYEQTTILDIVDNLGGLTRGAFYHHFKSKEDVLEALTEKLFNEDNPFQAVQDMKGATGLEKIKTIFLTHMGGGDDRKYDSLTRTAISLLQHPRFLAKHLKNNQEVAAMFEPLIEEGIADGSIRPGNAKLLAELGMLLLNIWFIPTIYPCNKAEFMSKLAIVKQILDSLGFPLLDEKTVKEKGAALVELLGIDAGQD